MFNWLEGIIELLPIEGVQELAYTILVPLVREMSEEDKNIDPRLRKIALRVGESIRAKIGDDDYNILRSQIQTKFMIKRAERRKKLVMEKVLDPARAAKRAHGMKERKKTAKKRKIDVIKGRIVGKKKRKPNPNDDVF